MLTACHGCGKPTGDGGFCDDCRGNWKDQMRLQGRSSPYRLQDWKRRARAFLRRNPTCVLCGKPSRVADHWPAERAELVANPGVRDPDDDRHLRALCLSCGGVRSAEQTVRFDNDPA